MLSCEAATVRTTSTVTMIQSVFQNELLVRNDLFASARMIGMSVWLVMLSPFVFCVGWC